MIRTNQSVVGRYNSGAWTPTYKTITTTSGVSGNWARILKTQLLSIGTENRITVTYICKRNSVIESAGYIYFDYIQELSLSNPPTTTLIHKYTDGDASLTNWLVSVASLTINNNESELYVNVSGTGLVVEFSVEADNLSQIESVYNNIVFTQSPPFTSPTYQVLTSNDIWQYNENEDIFNTNATGKVGINTGSSISSFATLDVNGNVHFRGQMSLQPPGSDHIYIDSYSDLGWDFRVWNKTDNQYRLFIDDVGQVGINTNAPQNRLHVVGNAQITDCVSIGAGNSPQAKLEVRGEGNTHATTALLIKNSDDRDLLRVYDDCVIEICGEPINGAIKCDDLIPSFLPTPDITNTWTATSFDDTPYNHPDGGLSSEENYTVARGAKVDFDGTYIYVVNLGAEQVEPERIDGDWGNIIPVYNTQSAPLQVQDITTTTTYTVNLYKQKTGLVLEDGQVVCPEPGEEDHTYDSATILFAESYYFGYTLDETPDATEVQTLMQDDKYLLTRKQTITGVDPVGSQYTVYAYPVAFGLLDDIILNGASAVLGAFNLDSSPQLLINHAGITVECYVYVSNAMDAFTDDELKFL